MNQMALEDNAEIGYRNTDLYAGQNYERPFSVVRLSVSGDRMFFVIRDAAERHVADGYSTKRKAKKAAEFILDLCNARYP